MNRGNGGSNWGRSWRGRRGWPRWPRGGNNGRGRGRGRGRGQQGSPPPESNDDIENIEAPNDSTAMEQPEDNYVSNVGAIDANRQMQRKKKRGKNNTVEKNSSESSDDSNEDIAGRGQRSIILKHIYSGWPDYLPNVKYKKGCSQEKVLLAFMNFLTQRTDWRKTALERGHFFIDYELITSDPVITADEALGSNFRTILLENPADTIAAISLAAHQIAVVEGGVELSAHDKRQAVCEGIYPISARIVNFGAPMPFRTLRADSYARLAVVCGTVVRMSSIRPTCVELAFKCLSCFHETVLPVADSASTSDKVQPTRCRPVDGRTGGARCLGRTFVACPHSPNTLSIDSRTIRIQEVTNNDDEARDAIPRCIDVELLRDLADQCSPGDVVTVCGVVKLRPAKESAARGVDDSSEFRLYIEANSLKHHSDMGSINSISSSQQPENDTTHCPGNANANKSAAFSESDLQAFQEIKSEPNLFRLLVQSLCPEIYGHELIKAGLVLSLFTGRSEENITQPVVEDTPTEATEAKTGSHSATRPNIHVLLVGDPGLGKSQLLRSLSDCAPRVVYVCGSSASVAGLGVAVNRDRATLQAGALVLADRGICCIDELDKMGGQEAVLLEVMEQQTLSVAKAGFVCSLPARCSIIAAANPSGGRYNHDRSVSENIRLPGAGALLSRFDLVFVILDRHDAEHDRMLSEHVIAAYSNNSSNKGSRSSLSSLSLSATGTQMSSATGAKALRRRLALPGNVEMDLLPHALLRKYVSYAVQTVQPKLTPKAAILLKNFYLDIRQRAQGFSDAPVTTRQLESLIRLAECRARLELREDVTESDARDVVDLMTGTLVDVFANKTADLVQLRPSGVPATSRQTAARRLVPLLQRLCEQNGSNLLSVDDISVAAGPMKLSKDQLSEVIANLNNQGFLIKKGQRQYQLQSSTF